MASAQLQETQTSFPAGQRLLCDKCGAEIEIVKPCVCHPPSQVFQCCGKEMHPSTR